VRATDEARQAIEDIWTAIHGGARVAIVNSPPGAGKSTLVREITRRLASDQQVPVIVQTNNQADDMVRGFLDDIMEKNAPRLRIGRLHKSNGWAQPDWMQQAADVTCASNVSGLKEVDVIVATAAKWERVTNGSWPVAIIDEAYQMRSSILQPIAGIAEALLAVGDPGQVAPFTDADDGPFRALDISPIESAAATLIKTHPDAPTFTLPVSWRLPPHSAELISRAFYRTPFLSGVSAGERRLELPLAALTDPYRQAVRIAANGGWSLVELSDLRSPNSDTALASAIAETVMVLLGSGITVVDGESSRPLDPSRVAVGAAHSIQVDAVRAALTALYRERGEISPDITVATANRLQGREFDVTIVWHPLSGRRDATAFHLDAGRLCVLLSRHRHACIVVSRAGVDRQLFEVPAVDEHWPGDDDRIDGWAAHVEVLAHLRGTRVAVA
jgi:energy-coupling factor transporter ATP-binding protein EcfA2